MIKLYFDRETSHAKNNFNLSWCPTSRTLSTNRLKLRQFVLVNVFVLHFHMKKRNSQWNRNQT